MCGFSDECKRGFHRRGTWCDVAQMRSTGSFDQDRELIIQQRRDQARLEASLELEKRRAELNRIIEEKYKERDKQSVKGTQSNHKLIHKTELRNSDSRSVQNYGYSPSDDGGFVAFMLVASALILLIISAIFASF